MAGRDPILRGTGQTDMTMAGFNILDVGAVGDIQQATLIVDPAIPEEIGERETGLPFKTLTAAVLAAEPGDTIILRPGIHAFDDSVDLFHLTGLRIIGYGAVITSASVENETTKILVRSENVTIEGIEFDGNVTGSPTITSDGCIEISETDCIIRNCFFHDWNGYAIHLPVHYDNIQISDNVFQTCLGAIFAEADPDTVVGTENIWIKRNKIQHNRTFGIKIVGPGVDNTRFLAEIQINDNQFSRNDVSSSTVPVLQITSACRGVQVQNNHFLYESGGVYLAGVLNVSVTGNNMRGINATAVNLQGCIGVKVTDNLIDGRNSSNVAATGAPILAAGFYSVANDAAQIMITGNQLIFLKTNSVAISVSNATGVVVNSNRIEGPVTFAGVVSGMINDNQFSIPQTTQAIILNALDTGMSRITIEGNRFRFTGASINRVITSVDASATGIDDVAIIGNSTGATGAFGTAAYGHSGSNAATRVFLIANTPEATSVLTDGWANTGSNLNIKRVYVSQARGNNTTAVRQSRTLKFATIAAAITAASDGDEVIVEDGTFNEKVLAKNGITLRFLPPAALVCTNVGGCIYSSADNQQFTVYHEHTPILCSQNSTTGINWSHAGAYLALHASLVHSGTGTLPYCLRVSGGSVEQWGTLAGNSICVSMGGGSGNPLYYLHGGLGPRIYDLDGTTGLELLKGEFRGFNATILGTLAGVNLNLTAATEVIFKRCSIGAIDTGKAVVVSVVGATLPIFRDCVLHSGSSATVTMDVPSAQTMLLYGQTVANKGSDPPTNVTFTGGGTYDVNANVVLD